jgi:hypothetical protein
MKAFSALLLLPLAYISAEPEYTALQRDRTKISDLRKLESTVLPEIKVSEIELTRLLSLMSPSDDGFPQLSIVLHSPAVGTRKVTLNVRNQNYAFLCDAIAKQTGTDWWIDGTVNFDDKKTAK